MKKLILMLLLGVSFALSQTQIFTQDANTRYKNYTAATAGDTLITKAAQASGGGVLYPEYKGYIVGVFMGTPIPTDTVTILNGVGIVARTIVPYTDTIPRFYPIGALVDTSLIVTKKKTGNTTVLFQTRRIN